MDEDEVLMDRRIVLHFSLLQKLHWQKRKQFLRFQKNHQKNDF